MLRYCYFIEGFAQFKDLFFCDALFNAGKKTIINVLLDTINAHSIVILVKGDIVGEADGLKYFSDQYHWEIHDNGCDFRKWTAE